MLKKKFLNFYRSWFLLWSPNQWKFWGWTSKCQRSIWKKMAWIGNKDSDSQLHENIFNLYRACMIGHLGFFWTMVPCNESQCATNELHWPIVMVSVEAIVHQTKLFLNWRFVHRSTYSFLGSVFCRFVDLKLSNWI